MLTVVTGPPCSGKTTHVAEHRDIGDLVVDLDTIARALGYPDPHVEFGTGHPVTAAARIARTAIVQALTAGQLDGDAWVIDTKPARGALGAYRRAGATVITLDPGRDVCHQRATADGRPASTHEQIDAWYSAGALGVFGS